MLRRLPARVDWRGVRHSQALLVFALLVVDCGCTYDYARFKEEAPNNSAGAPTTLSPNGGARTGQTNGDNSTPVSGGAVNNLTMLPQLGGNGATATSNTVASNGGQGIANTNEAVPSAGGSTLHVTTSGGTSSAPTTALGGSTTPDWTSSNGGGVSPTSASTAASGGGSGGSSARGGSGGSVTGASGSTAAGGTSSTSSTNGIAGSSTSCTPPLVDCSGTCVNLTSDAMHCGACGRACFQASASWAICIDQRCSCNSGGSLCAAGQICEKKSVCVDFPK